MGNLRTDLKWKLVDSFYNDGPEGLMYACENCGRNISHIAKIEDPDGNRSTVGMDCAETLTSLDPLTFDSHKYGFLAAQSIKNKILKIKKTEPETKITYIVYDNNHADINFAHTLNGRFIQHTWKSFSVDVFNKYVYPMIKNLGVTKGDV